MKLHEFDAMMGLWCGTQPETLKRVRRDALQPASTLWALYMLSLMVGRAERIVEVGSHKGGMMLWLTHCFLPKHVTCVDPFDGATGPADELMAAFEDNARHAGSDYGASVVLMREQSPGAAAVFANKSVDLVYIDGDHVAEVVGSNLAGWWPKVRLGGMLVGHGYVGNRPGVVEAVDAFSTVTPTFHLSPSSTFYARRVYA